MCDDPEYFYAFIDEIIGALVGGGLRADASSPAGVPIPSARELLRAVQVRGAGYAISTREELQTVKVRSNLFVCPLLRRC